VSPGGRRRARRRSGGAAAADDRGRAGLVELLSDDPTIGSSARHRPGTRQSSERAAAPGVSQLGCRGWSAGDASQPSRRRGPDRAGGHAARASTGFSAARGWRRHRARSCAPSTLATDNVVWTPATGFDDYPGGPRQVADDPLGAATTGP
jgi:hypothetical protein